MCSAPKKLPSIEYLNECFECLGNDGLLIWKIRPISHFKDDRSQMLQNAQFAGRVAGSGKPYLRSKIANNSFLNHRIIFFMSHGFIPQEIDHIDGNKANNRLDNLREATRSQNMHNKSMPRNNTSGIKGVHFHKYTKKWTAACKINNKFHHLGLFESVDEAAQAVIKFREDALGNFANHGACKSNGTPLFTRKEPS